VVYLKKAFNQSGLTKKKMKELVIRSLYVEMLGLDASFAYIRGVELCASTSITQKRVGYLAGIVFLQSVIISWFNFTLFAFTASLCLSPTHEFRFMLVNQIQRDMKSTNLLEVCAALNALCKIVTDDMIPAVVTDVNNRFSFLFIVFNPIF
jgi:AP-4 complex subunit epsilon-1